MLLLIHCKLSIIITLCLPCDSQSLHCRKSEGCRMKSTFSGANGRQSGLHCAPLSLEVINW